MSVATATTITPSSNKKKKRNNQHKNSGTSANEVEKLLQKQQQTNVTELESNKSCKEHVNSIRVNISRSAAGTNWQQASLQNQNNNENIQKEKGNNIAESSAAKTAVERNKNNPTSVSCSNECVDDDNDDDDDGNSSDAGMPTTQQPSKSARARQRRKANQLNRYVALDCEMVGTGANGDNDMLARVSIVNKKGEVLLDTYVKPRDLVTDYRTSVSGIRPNDIENAEDFNVVQNKVIELLQGKILIGHAIRNDLTVLHIKHPYASIRDTSRYKPLNRMVSHGRTPSLKRLSQLILGVEIQNGEHNSVEDARAAMNIYNRLATDWEKYIQKNKQRNK